MRTCTNPGMVLLLLIRKSLSCLSMSVHQEQKNGTCRVGFSSSHCRSGVVEGFWVSRHLQVLTIVYAHAPISCSEDTIVWAPWRFRRWNSLKNPKGHKPGRPISTRFKSVMDSHTWALQRKAYFFHIASLGDVCGANYVNRKNPHEQMDIIWV